MKSDSFRLACGIYEEIELLSMRRNRVSVIINDDNNSTKEIIGIITDVYVKNKVEFIQIDKEFNIESSQIINVTKLDNI